MKKNLMWGLNLFLVVLLAMPAQAQLATRTDLSLEDITEEINKLVEQGDEGKAQMAIEADALAQSDQEGYRMLAARIYRFVGNAEAAERVNNSILKDFPKGVLARDQAMSAIFSDKEASVSDKETAYHAWLANYPSTSFNEDQQAIYSQAALLIGRELVKDQQSRKIPALVEKNKLAGGPNYALISSLAREMANEGLYQESLVILEPAFNHLQKEEDELTVHRTLTGQYASALIESGKAPEGIALIEGLFAKNPASANAPSNVISLAKGYAAMGRNFDAYQQLEKHLMTRSVNEDIMKELASLYVVMNNGQGDAAAYRSALEQQVLEALQERLKASMIKSEAPKFRLRNMQGEFVSLDDMRGKIVVLDFWATWCGPCIVSFPGMQMAVNKYENDPEVEFLFIDTWQNEENYEELVTNFIAENQYTFHVLYDEMVDRDNATVTAYGVRGIPTKVFIDKDGYIRFQSAGGSADATNVWTEVVAKVELIREAQSEE